MSKINCEIIKDLLPLYTDKACSKETMDAVEEHIHNCPVCEAELIKLQSVPDISSSVDEDIDKAVKKANKRIKKGKKKAVIKTLSITLSILLVVGLLAYLIVPVKIAYRSYCDDGFSYSQYNLLDIEISNKTKPNYSAKYADVYIDESLGKYTVTEIQDGNKIEFQDGKMLIISYIPTIKEYVKPFYEEVGMFGIGGRSNFPYFNPIIKKGLENMGLNPDTLYADNRLYTMLLKSRDESWTDHKAPLNPKEFTMWYTYYALYVNIMPGGSPVFGYYIHAENSTLRGWGWSGFNEELGNKYIIQLQPKDNIYDNYNLIFTGFQKEEMIEIVESVVIR